MTLNRLKVVALLIALVLVPASAAAQTTPADPDKWQFTFTPYAFIPGITGRAGIGDLTVDVDAALTDDDLDLNFAFMSTFEARKNRFLILTDLQYSNLGSDRATPGPLFGSAQADFKTFVLDPEVGYRVFQDPEKGHSVDVLGGVRVWRVTADLDFTPGILPGTSASRSRSWVDAVGGMRGRFYVTPKIFLVGKGDIAGGGSEFSFQLFGGGGYQVNDRIALIGGYRHLAVDYDRNNFLFDMALAGPVFGVGFRF